MNATTTTHAGLLAAICANPADDTPRLVLADWLEEAGEHERARYIREQIANPSEDYDDRPHPEWVLPLAAAVGASLEKSLDESAYRYFGTASISLDESLRRNITFEWSRGFVASIRCAATEWLTHGPAIVAAQPIERVRLAGVEPEAFQTRWRFSDSHRGVLWPSQFYEMFLSEWTSEQSALAAQSRCCLAWARAAKAVQP